MQKTLVLRGEHVCLEPLGFEHAAALREYCADERLWQYVFSPNPFTDAASTNRWIQAAIDAKNEVAFAIIDAQTGEFAGSTRYMDIVPDYRKLEIGWTFLAPQYWRTRINTEAKYVLFRYAFEEWNAMRVQLKAEALNQRSRNAIARIGATYEGTFRNFRIRYDGSRRDVSFYSVIDAEWPVVKERLLSFMHAAPSGTEAAVALDRNDLHFEHAGLRHRE